MVNNEQIHDFFRRYPDRFIDSFMPEIKLSFLRRIYIRILGIIYS